MSRSLATESLLARTGFRSGSGLVVALRVQLEVPGGRRGSFHNCVWCHDEGKDGGRKNRTRVKPHTGLRPTARHASPVRTHVALSAARPCAQGPMRNERAASALSSARRTCIRMQAPHRKKGALATPRPRLPRQGAGERTRSGTYRIYKYCPVPVLHGLLGDEGDVVRTATLWHDALS
jgi:hypothetical protein